MHKELVKMALQKIVEMLPKMTKEQQKQFFLWLSLAFLIFSMGRFIYEQNRLIEAYEKNIAAYEKNIAEYNKQLDDSLQQVSDELKVMRIILEMKDPDITKKVEKYYKERRESHK